MGIWQVLECEKNRMHSVLELGLAFNQLWIKMDLKNLQEPNWDEATDKWKLDVYKFRIKFISGWC